MLMMMLMTMLMIMVRFGGSCWARRRSLCHQHHHQRSFFSDSDRDPRPLGPSLLSEIDHAATPSAEPREATHSIECGLQLNDPSGPGIMRGNVSHKGIGPATLRLDATTTNVGAPVAPWVFCSITCCMRIGWGICLGYALSPLSIVTQA